MATHADAQLVLKFYELRREEVCRKARAWFAGWAPKTEEEVKKVVSGANAEENAWMRQSTSYWEMVFSIGNTGAIDSALLGKNCGEGIWFAVKCKGLKAKFPGAWSRTMPEAEAFLNASPELQGRIEMFQKRVDAQLG